MMGKKRIIQPASAAVREHARQSVQRLERRMPRMDDITRARARWTITMLQEIYKL